MNIIDGKKIAQKIKNNLKKKILLSPVQPGLGVILVGNDPASHLYVSLKEKACREVGINFKKFLFPTRTPAEKIIKKIKELNSSKSIHGILIQLPLPSHLPTNKIIETIYPQKDVDGFHPQNIQKILKGQKTVEPVLVKAIWKLIQSAQNSSKTKSRSCLILGKSDIFTLPLKATLENKKLKVIRSNSENLDLQNLKKNDITIVALGKPNFLKGTLFKPGAIIIDVGINQLKNGKIVGDVDFSTTISNKGWITPVPGGVGPVTVAMLLENVYLLSKKYGSDN